MSSFEDALELHQQGKFEQAQKHYQNLLKLQPEHADAQHLLGVTNLQMGNLELAQQQIKKALKLNNQVADYWINLSQVEKLNDNLEAALASLRSALKLAPNHTQGWNNLGNLQQQLEQHQDAIKSYNEALKLQPNYANAHYNLSISLGKQCQLSRALEHCKTALQLEPKNIEYWGQFSQFLVTAGESKQATKILQQGLQIHPNNIQLSCELASLIAEDGELNRALELYQKVLKQKPDHALALSQLLYLKRSVCDWHNLDQYYQQLQIAIDQQQPYISPFSFLTENSSPAQQLQCAKLWSQQFLPINDQKLATVKVLRQQAEEKSTKKIVIGYVSADFYQHPTAYLAARLFEQHDRSKFKIIAYSNSRDDNSDMIKRLKKAFDLFVDIKTISLDEIIEKIKRDKVDILVDLKGYTLEASTEIFARRAAPIQVNYLGYPGTMGAQFMDYIIGDRFVTPINAAADFSEKIVQLDCCYQINDNQRPHPTKVPSKKSLGLPEEKFIFGCFNNSWKITPEIFAVWMNILKQCPNSVLWLMDRHPKSNFKNNILSQVKQYGIDDSRIIFAKTAAYEEYLSYYLQLDLFLETVPYNAHTMASDALWMGCPVLSVSGETFCARVGESILAAVGLSQELFCEDFASFIERAKALYESQQQLTKIKDYLNLNRTQLELFNSEKTVTSIEQAFQQMYNKLHNQQAADHIIIE